MKIMMKYVWYFNDFENLAIPRKSEPPEGYIKGRRKRLVDKIRE
jgi:hypothetical protein